MNSQRLQKMFLPLLFVGAAAFFLVWEHEGSLDRCTTIKDSPEKQNNGEANWHHHNGHAFGTYYNIRYSSSRDLEWEISDCLERFDHSMSTFNTSSTVSRLNTNESDSTDEWFDEMFATASEVSILSGGAFDITVAPLVNAWGFGFRNKEKVTPKLIDSLLRYVDYEGLQVEGGRLIKRHKETLVDASAIAKGQACDVVARTLSDAGCENILVDIGGEVVCRGVNEQGSAWRIGITRPDDDPSGTNRALQAVVSSNNLCMATSGNYRQFYYDGGVRRSHTIDPRTGYPAESNLLSSTVTARSCMLADALATACMVLGSDSALALIDRVPGAECYLITSCGGDSLCVVTSAGFPLDK